MELLNVDARNKNAVTILNPYATPSEDSTQYPFSERVSVDARYELRKAHLEDPDLILSVRITLPSGVTAKFRRSGPWRSAHDGGDKIAS